MRQINILFVYKYTLRDIIQYSNFEIGRAVLKFDLSIMNKEREKVLAALKVTFMYQMTFSWKLNGQLLIEI